MTVFKLLDDVYRIMITVYNNVVTVNIIKHYYSVCSKPAQKSCISIKFKEKLFLKTGKKPEVRCVIHVYTCSYLSLKHV